MSICVIENLCRLMRMLNEWKCTYINRNIIEKKKINKLYNMLKPLLYCIENKRKIENKYLTMKDGMVARNPATHTHTCEKFGTLTVFRIDND